MDVQVSNHGSIYVLTPITDVAREWIDEYIPEDAMRWGKDGVVVEPRYVDLVIAGMREAGLVVG